MNIELESAWNDRTSFHWCIWYWYLPSKASYKRLDINILLSFVRDCFSSIYYRPKELLLVTKWHSFHWNVTISVRIRFLAWEYTCLQSAAEHAQLRLTSLLTVLSHIDFASCGENTIFTLGEHARDSSAVFEMIVQDLIILNFFFLALVPTIRVVRIK